jgi:hypothetical protein
MGYTHYWEGAVIVTPALAEDAAKLAKASKVKLGNWEGKSKPEFREDLVSLNGSAASDEDYESFVLESGYQDSFCKTANRPYDEVVTATLLRAAELNPGLEVTSDGDWSEWEDGRALYSKVFKREPQRPAKIRD